MEQESLLTDIEYNPVLASVGKRFLNYLIDTIIFIIPLVFVLAIFFTSETYTYNQYQEQNSFSNELMIRLIAIVIYVLLYFLSETIFKGRTVGKFITGTKAVNEDGTIITAKTALLRTLCRLVPFEVFSAFGGHPWHDKWTHTFVIDVKKTAETNVVYQA